MIFSATKHASVTYKCVSIAYISAAVVSATNSFSTAMAAMGPLEH